MKNVSLIFLLFSVLIISFNSCKKDKASAENYRLIRTQYTNFLFPIQGIELNTTYENDRIASISIGSSSKVEYTYSGDSIIAYNYWFENNIWNNTSIVIYKYHDDLMSIAYTYSMTSNNNLSKSIFDYEGGNIVEINGYDIIGDSTKLYDSQKFYYNSNKLDSVSFSYKAFLDQDIVENVKREFTYKDGNLYEEFIYTDFNGYPIQLSRKKVYFYENDKVDLVEHYKFENNAFILNLTETREYDNYGNLVKIIETNVSGEIVSEYIMTYEAGEYSCQTYYDITSGSESKIPLP